MKAHQKKVVTILWVAFCGVFSSFLPAFAEEYDALKGVESAKAIFDMRDCVPESAAAHIQLIHNTYKTLSSMKKKPVFVIVFMAGAVKLISSHRSGYSTHDQKYMGKIADSISKMLEEGIRVEVCLAAVAYFNVDPASILPGIKHVGNGWISEIGYQARGYSLVPVY